MTVAGHVHPTALVETDAVGPGTHVWAFTHVLDGARIGADCNIGDHCYVESGAVVGDHVTVKNGTSLWAGVTLEDGVFVGPAVVFTNDRRPRSPRLGLAAGRYADASRWLEPTCVGHGATLGAGAVLVAGVSVGAFAFVAAGAVVTRDVPPHALVAGNPARVVGRVCGCGARIALGDGPPQCTACAAAGLVAAR